MFEGRTVWELELVWFCVSADHGKRSGVQPPSHPPLSLFLTHTHTYYLLFPTFPFCTSFLSPFFFGLVLSPASPTLTHNLPLSSLLFFHVFTSPCLCDAFVSGICRSPSRGMLLAASSRLLLLHSHAGSLWVGLCERGSQPRKWTRKFSQEFSFFYVQPRLCRNSFIAVLVFPVPRPLRIHLGKQVTQWFFKSTLLGIPRTICAPLFKSWNQKVPHLTTS